MHPDKPVYIFGPVTPGRTIVYDRWVVTKLPDGTFSEEHTTGSPGAANTLVAHDHAYYSLYARWWDDLMTNANPLVRITGCRRRARAWLERGGVKDRG